MSDAADNPRDEPAGWRQRGRRAARMLAVNILLLVIFLAATELLFGLLLRHPAALTHAPDRIRTIFQRYYGDHDRAIIQYDPACARYDAELFYTLRPGECTFENREFSSTYRINRQGVRDDEESLQAPRVIVLGDSLAMGWGVDQEETFAQVLERETGMRVLNAAVSSYGTARELRLLQRLDVSALEFLVLQHHPSDFRENQRYVDGGGFLAISDEETYRDAARHHQAKSAYRLGKHVLTMLRIKDAARALLRGAGLREDPSPPPTLTVGLEEQAVAFLRVLRAASIPWDQVTVLWIDIHGHARNDPAFGAAVMSRWRQEAARSPGRLVFLDVSEALGPDDYFVLDDHLRASGHQAVATVLRAEILRSGATPP